MQVCGPVEGARRIHTFMGVVRSSCHPARKRIPSNIRGAEHPGCSVGSLCRAARRFPFSLRLASLHIEAIDRQGTLGAAYGGIAPSVSCERIYQKLILAFGSFPHEDARLFLVGKTLAEEVPVPCYLEGVIGFNGEQFLNSLPDGVTARNRVQVLARVTGLLLDPSARPRESWSSSQR